MKGKFSLIWRVAVALVLVLSFSLVAAVPVGASPDVSDVRVELSDYRCGSATADNVTYYVYFTPGADLAKNVDTITVFFPTGTTSIAATDNVRVDQDGDAVVYGNSSNLGAAAKSVAGYRFILTTPVDITAGTPVRVEIDGIDNPDLTTLTPPPATKAYTLKVYTSQETEQVESSSYTIGVTQVTSVNFTPTLVAGKAVVGAAYEYVVDFTTANVAGSNLAGGWDTVTVIFPAGTTVPDPITAATVEFDGDGGGGYTPCGTVNVSGNAVTVTVPLGEDVAQNAVGSVKFTTAAGIKNGTLATDANNPQNAGEYVGKVRTSKDLGIVRDAGFYVLDAAAPCALGFLATSPTSVPVNAASGNITVQSKDQYGNLSDVPVDVDVQLSSSSATGLLLGDEDGNGTLGDDTGTWKNTNVFTRILQVGATDISAIFKYKDTMAGTATITASYPAHAWTPATWEIEVYALGEVELYDGTVLIGTYTTIKAALNDAAVGNTIKVGPGTYSATSGETFPITLNKAEVTIQSTDGAASTTIAGTAGSDVFQIAANEITIQGFTITTGQYAIINPAVAARDSVVIKDNVVTTTHGMSCGYFQNSTIENNTVEGATSSFGIGLIGTPGGPYATGNTVKNNTSNNPLQSGIWLDNASNNIIEGNTCDGNNWAGLLLRVASDDNIIRNNTFTNNSTNGPGIQVSDVGTAACTNNVILNNTVTGNGEAGIVIANVAGTAASTTVKFNTISGNTNHGLRNDDSAAAVDATHNWWGDDSGPSGVGPGSGDAVSTDVTYEPWLGASVSAGATAANAASLDAQNTAGVNVSGVAGFGTATLIGAARYTANPAGTPEFTPLENGFFDVFVKNPDAGAGTSTEIGIKFYDAAITSDSVAYMWDAFEETWKLCTEQSAISGMVWVKARPYSATVPAVPTIEDLAGTPFAISGVPVRTLQSIEVTPPTPEISVGGTQQFTATGTYNLAPLTEDITATVTWASSNLSVATIDAAGLATGVAVGTTNITATLDPIVSEPAVVLTVSVWDPMIYDADEDGVISKTEALNAVVDYFDLVITKDQALQVIVEYMG